MNRDDPSDLAQDEAASAPFTVLAPDDLPVPVLIAVPHAGRVYSAAVREALRDPVMAALRLEDRFVDRVGDGAAALTGAALISATTPRAVIDLNRAPEDIDWSMIAGGANRRASHSAGNLRSRHGLGLVPRRVHGMGELWKRRLPVEELERRIGEVHRPYHQAVGETLERLRDRWGHALLIDLHSMPPLARQGDCEAAELVIGDRFGASCASALSHAALRYLEQQGRRVALNRPYSGGYALDRHAIPRRNIHALQVEICRSTYLDGRLDAPGPRLNAVVRQIAGLVRVLAGELAALCGEGSFRNAAE